MRAFNTLGAVVAILIGVAAIVVDTWSNVEFLAGKPLTPSALLEPGIWSSNTAAVVVVAIATAAALTTAGVAWRGRRLGLAAGLFAAFLCGAAFSLSATLDRVATSKDAGVSEKQDHNRAIASADAAIAEATRNLVTAQAGMKRECDGRDPARLDPGRWPICRGHWQDAEEATAALTLARAQRDRLGATRVEDSGAARIAAMIPGLSPQQVTLYQPVLLPAALFLFGNLMTAFGFAGLTTSSVARPRVTAKAERPMRDITPVVSHDPVVAALRQMRGPVNNGELARILGWSDATAHRRVNELISEGIVQRARNGREVAIALVSARPAL